MFFSEGHLIPPLKMLERGYRLLIHVDCINDTLNNVKGVIEQKKTAGCYSTSKCQTACVHMLQYRDRQSVSHCHRIKDTATKP